MPDHLIRGYAKLSHRDGTLGEAGITVIYILAYLFARAIIS
jgi:hypothetical protein